jgi:xylitol oxidase
VSLFTDWRSPTHINHLWRKRVVEGGADDAPAEAEWMGATLATQDVHPIATESAVNCTPQQGIPGPWYDRLPHFRMDYTPSSGEEIQTEYFVPRGQALSAFRALGELREQIAPLLQISEIRTIAADDLWMSPCYGRDCVAFHFTWKRDWPAVSALLPTIEARLAPFEARPHWGKCFTVEPGLLPSLYEKLPDFQALARQFDPEGKFRNAFLDRYIFG